MLPDLPKLIEYIGLFGIYAIVFAESGLLLGFFLPGDSLLFTAGFLASLGKLNITWLVIGCSIAAIVGDSVGYTFGRRIGPRIFKREDSLLFHKENIVKAQAFYKKHGGKTIVLARFMPAIRTFAPIVAGVGGMHYPTFLMFNVIGGIFWVFSMTFLGYFLGNVIPDIDLYIIPIVLIIVLLSVLPGIIHIWRDNPERAKKQLRGLLAYCKSKIFCR